MSNIFTQLAKAKRKANKPKEDKQRTVIVEAVLFAHLLVEASKDLSVETDEDALATEAKRLAGVLQKAK